MRAYKRLWNTSKSRRLFRNKKADFYVIAPFGLFCSMDIVRLTRHTLLWVLSKLTPEVSILEKITTRGLRSGECGFLEEIRRNTVFDRVFLLSKDPQQKHRTGLIPPGSSVSCLTVLFTDFQIMHNFFKKIVSLIILKFGQF